MPTMMIRHKVKDFESWKPVFDKHGAMRREYGIRDVSLHRDAHDPNEVVVVAAADDIERMQEFAKTDDLREAMQEAGVVSEPTVWFLDDVR